MQPTQLDWGTVVFQIMAFDFAKFFAAVAGAAVSMIKWPGTLKEKFTLGAAGVLVSFFASVPVAQITKMPEGLCGFLLGLFGMMIVAKIWDIIESIDAKKTWDDIWNFILRKGETK